MYPSQTSFRATVFPDFLPETLLFGNERNAGQPGRENCDDLVSPSDKNYLFRFIGRLTRFKGCRVCKLLINVFRECWRKFVPLNKAFPRDSTSYCPSFSSATESFAGSHIVYCRFDFTWATLRLLPQTEFAYQLHAGMHYVILYAALHNYCILKRILDKVYRLTLKEIRYFIL